MYSNADTIKFYESLKKSILLLFEVTGIYCESLFAIVNDKPIDKNNIKKLIKEPAVNELGLFERFYKNSDFEYLQKNEQTKF